MSSRRSALLVGALIAALVGLVVPFAPAPAFAATIDVTRADDPVPDGCRRNDCSLREAVIASNNRPGPDLIQLRARRYDLTLEGANEDDSQTGDLDVHENVTIRGTGPRQTIIHGNRIDRVFEIGYVGAPEEDVPTDVVLKDLGVRGGRDDVASSNGGGGILTFGGLSLRGVRVAGNRAPHCCGGGVAGEGAPLKVIDSTISKNSALEYGGGIYANAGHVVIRNSRILSNKTTDGCCGAGAHVSSAGKIVNTLFRGNEQNDASAGTDAGGGGLSVAMSTGDRLRIAGSTFAANSAERYGGGIWFEGTGGLRVVNSTLSSNTSNAIGGGFAEHDTGRVRLLYSTFAFNESSGPGNGIGSDTDNITVEGLIVSNHLQDCNGTITGTDGVNLDSDGDCFSDPDALHGGARLRQLDYYGGLTPTHALRATSAAVDAAPATECPPPVRDQRGVARPQNGDGQPGNRCDLGSFERQP